MPVMPYMPGTFDICEHADPKDEVGSRDFRVFKNARHNWHNWHNSFQHPNGSHSDVADKKQVCFNKIIIFLL